LPAEFDSLLKGISESSNPKYAITCSTLRLSALRSLQGVALRERVRILLRSRLNAIRDKFGLAQNYKSFSITSGQKTCRNWPRVVVWRARPHGRRRIVNNGPRTTDELLAKS